MATSPLSLRVDDDEDGRFLITRELRKEFPQCVLVQCASADEALQAVNERVDAVVTDNHLSNDSGIDLIREMRKRKVTCPIIMVTASIDPRVEEAAYAAGASKVFTSGSAGFAELLRATLAGRA